MRSCTLTFALLSLSYFKPLAAGWSSTDRTLAVQRAQQIVSAVQDEPAARRLFEAQKLPEACQTKCPAAQGAMDALQKEFMPLALKHASTMAKVGESMGGGEPKALDIKELMNALTPFLKDLLYATFDNMCANPDAFKCVALNAGVCNPNSGGDLGALSMMSMDPAQMSSQFSKQMGCFCETCPGAKTAYTDMMVEMVAAIFSGLASMGNENANSKLDKEIEKAMMTAACPMVSVSRCFARYPTQCNSMLKGSDAEQGMNMIASGSNMTELAAKCTAQGISMKVAGVVRKISTSLKFKGLDYAKVDANPELKDSIIKKVKASFLQKMTGYQDSDVKVTLSAGSVVATIELTPLPGSSSEKTAEDIKSIMPTFKSESLSELKILPQVSTALTEGTSIEQLTAKEGTVGVETIQDEVSGAKGVRLLGAFGLISTSSLFAVAM
jgi:hypothetical protein